MESMNYDCKLQKLKRRISASVGDSNADLVFKNGKVLNVFTNETETADVAVLDGYIVGIGDYKGEKEIDLQGAVVCPGLIDGHIHLESSMISPYEFAKAVVPHGTTAIVIDPHEIANVAGSIGIDYMLETTRYLPLNTYIMLPSCVPSTGTEEAGAALEAADLEQYYHHPCVLGLAEVMNSYGTVRGDVGILIKILGVSEGGGTVDGHGPGLKEKELNAYVTAGIRSDHECSTSKEAIEKIKRGQWIMIREGTAAKNLKALLPMFRKKYYSRCMLVTDDKHPGDLIQNGHMDFLIREAIRYGADPVVAVKMASLHPAQYFGLKEQGAVAPGYRANLVIIDDLEIFNVLSVYRNGILVAEKGKLIESESEHYSIPVSQAINSVICNSFHMPEIHPEDINIDIYGKFKRVIGLVTGELLTKELVVPNWTCGISDQNSLTQVAKGVELDRNIVKLIVCERHRNTGHVGIGYVYGYGIKQGAIASSVAHDSHNLIVIGVNDEDICMAANQVRKNKGGLAIVENGKVLSEFPLPIAGLMCNAEAKHAGELLYQLKEIAYSLGVSKDIDPFMTLAFLSLPVIPSLRLTTNGLMDVESQSIVPSIFG